MTASATCGHAHTRVIAEDEFMKYLECMDCGLLFEAEELAEVDSQPAPLKVDLADA